MPSLDLKVTKKVTPPNGRVNRRFSMPKISDARPDDSSRGRKIEYSPKPSSDKHSHSAGEHREIKSVLNHSPGPKLRGSAGKEKEKEKDRKYGRSFVSRSHIQSSEMANLDDDEDTDDDFAVITALLRNSQKDTWYKFPIKVKSEPYKPKDLLKMLRNSYSHLSLISFQHIEDTIGSTHSFLNYENSVSVNQFKFGVIYLQGSQDEDQMYNNKTTSEDYEKFLELLGDKVALKDRREWSGGLDTKDNKDGNYGLVNHHPYGDVVFHVATMMKHVEGDTQQIAKKRHIGNDVVLIIFKEARGTFSPAFMASHFNHVFIVVKKLVSESKRVGKTLYRVSVTAREQVGQFQPYLPKDQKFEHGSVFSRWLLAKCINGELASYQASGLAEPRNRVKETLLRSCLTEYRTNT